MAINTLLLAAAGAAVYLASGKKKKPAAKKKTTGELPSPAPGVDNIAMSGTKSGWKWRVRRDLRTGYYGEVQAPDSKEWAPAHPDPRPKPESAKLLAWETIAKRLEEIEVEDVKGEAPIIFAAGELGGWKWRVRQTEVPSAVAPGVMPGFFGEIQAADSDEWTSVHADVRLDPAEAELLAQEAIAKAEIAKDGE